MPAATTRTTTNYHSLLRLSNQLNQQTVDDYNNKNNKNMSSSTLSTIQDETNKLMMMSSSMSSETSCSSRTSSICSSESDHDDKNDDDESKKEEKVILPAKTMPCMYPIRIGYRSHDNETKPEWLNDEMESKQDRFGIEKNFDIVMDDLIRYCADHCTVGGPRTKEIPGYRGDEPPATVEKYDENKENM